MSNQPRKPPSSAKRRPISQREAQRYFKVSRAAQFVPPKDEPVPRIAVVQQVDPDDVDVQRGVKTDPVRKR